MSRLEAWAPLVACLLAPASAHASAADRAAQADRLFRSAVAQISQPTLQARLTALAQFEEAARLAPNRSDIWLAFGNACLESGRPSRARACFQRATRVGGGDDEAWLALGRAWKDEWLASQDRSSLVEAWTCFERASAIAPGRGEAWNAQAALLLLLGQPRSALIAARRAGEADPGGAESLLMLGSACYRAGLLADAGRAFVAARERLTPDLQRRLDGDLSRPEDSAADIPPDSDGLATAFDRSDSDPDLTTLENEALLEYRTRVSLAWFLFRVGSRMHWDQRAELFARYGPPESVEYGPAAAQVGQEHELEFQVQRRRWVPYRPEQNPFPYHLQVWHYPQLGMDVPLWDLSLTHTYELSYSHEIDQEPRPDLERVAARPDLVALSDGRGVFRALPPGARPLEIRGAVSRFPQGERVRVLAHAFAPGSPADTMRGSWALVADDGTVVAREANAMGISACDPADERVVEFAADVAPGDYRLDLAVQGTRGRRGLLHRRVHVDASGDRLTMSDLVPLCADHPAPSTREVRIEPETRQRVSERAMIVYYELDHLSLDAAGTARFAYTYSVRSRAPKRKRAPAVVEATREEENAGAHRRQFVTVPTAGLAPGPYELRIEVRDLTSGDRVENVVSFTR